MPEPVAMVTISDEGWLHSHAKRWLRMARHSNPEAYLCLLYAGDGVCPYRFDMVKQYSAKEANREWYNEIRMRACRELGIPKVVYCDADADVLESLNGVWDEMGDARLGFVRSPAPHGGWARTCTQLGYKWPSKVYQEANNGFLAMRGDFDVEYKAAVEKLAKVNPSERVKGMQAFTVMVQDAENDGAFKVKELGDEWSAIWWRCQDLLNGKVIQYCNDNGQKKRMELERLWEAVQI